MIDLTTLGTVTSRFGFRDRPTAGASANHKGIDIVLRDPNIPAVMGGTVTKSGYNSTMGNYVQIQQTDGTLATYMHMKNPSTYSAGMTVAEGATVGVMGSTGVSTGAHVHYQVEKPDGTHLDPAEYFKGGASFFAAENGGSNNIEISGILGATVSFVAMLILCIFAVVLFLKAFDINIM